MTGAVYANVLVAVPTRGQVQWQTCTALEAARDYTQGMPPILYQEGGLSVALTRNRIVKRFLDTDCTALAMVDDDIAPPINFVEMLAPHLDEYAMVGLPHPMPVPGNQGVIGLGAFRVDREGYRAIDLYPGVNECDALATGCVLVRRDVFTVLGPAPFRMAHDPDDAIQSDDFLFCRELRAAGLRVGALWDGIPVDHFRQVTLAPILERQLERSR